MSKTILLVEDEENDVFFLQQAFKEVGIFNPVQVAHDGQEAMDYLSDNGSYADRARFPLPGLMLLDLKLPRVMGFEVLKWVRKQPGLNGVVVVVLTSSRLGPDIAKAYQLGANAYLVKPSNPSELRKIAAGIKQFWLELNQSPNTQPETAEALAHRPRESRGSPAMAAGGNEGSLHGVNTP